MKYIITLILSFILTAGLSGCGDLNIGEIINPVDKPLFDILGDDAKLFFENFSDSSAVNMTVNYDQHYPEATVTDKELMIDMVQTLSEIMVKSKTNISKTDGYHYVCFVTAEGKKYSISFEQDLLHYDGDNYKIENAQAFWKLFKSTAANYSEKPQTDGTPLFEFFAEPDITAFEENFYKDMPDSLTFSLYWYDAFDDSVTEKEIVAAAFEALGKISVGEETDIRVTDSDTQLCFTYGDGREYKFAFNGGNLMTYSDEKCYLVSGSEDLWALINELYGQR